MDATKILRDYPPTQFLLTVSIAEQTVSLFEQNKFVKKFSCSTSRFGIGH
jgi:hypothetical protein